MQREDPTQLQARCDDWNRRYPVGTRVRYWPAAGRRDFKVSRTESEASVLGGHTAVVLVEGVSGVVSLGHVEAIVPDSTSTDRATKAIQAVLMEHEPGHSVCPQKRWELAKRCAIAALNAADDTCEAQPTASEAHA